jgi:glycerophosphoryl diester phosphodiesterase
MNFPFERPLVIAHRGARSLAPENTILAAGKGLQTGADLWELDVAMSKDSAIVVIHDDTLIRTSNAKDLFPDRSPWSVHSFDLAELKSLDFGSWYIKEDPFHQIADGKVSLQEINAMKGLQIPTLEEALSFTKANKWRVNVEIKDLSGLPGNADIVEKVVGLIQKYEMVHDVLISSFNHSYIERVKLVEKEIKTAALVPSPVPDPIALLHSLGAQAYNPGIYKLTDFAEIRTIREAGFDVNVWTVNDAETIRKLINAGVSAIFTDFPQVMVEVLREYLI